MFVLQIDNFFCLGSPLSVFLALRVPKGQHGYHLFPPTLCNRLYNIFHLTDPVAYRCVVCLDILIMFLKRILSSYYMFTGTCIIVCDRIKSRCIWLLYYTYYNLCVCNTAFRPLGSITSIYIHSMDL